MPTVTTLEGFLVVAGTVMIIISLFSGGIKLEKVEFPALGKYGRIIMSGLGGIFLCVGLYLYYIETDFASKKPIPAHHLLQ